ncbi:MAG: hypothetical protein H0Z24_03435 [Thermosipho sp. (in: Bacteria)]|nr:hypothetical protein [Thermosipho sp. (in: thermotogales)]
MKHILFGLNQSADKRVENEILKEYKKSTGEEFLFDSEYYLEGIRVALDKKKYDVLILREDLEGSKQISISYLDEITDKFPNLRVILLVQNENQKTDYIKRLFSIGIYDVLFAEDASLTNVVELIKKGRTKIEAKIYYDLLDADDVEVYDDSDDVEEIPEEQLERILSQLAKAPKEELPALFNEIAAEYNSKQTIFLISLLSEEVTEALLESEDEKFKNFYAQWEALNRKQYEKELAEKERLEKEKKQVINTPRQQVVFPADYRKVIGIFSPYSAGKTTIACAVAQALSKQKIKTVLIDLDYTKNDMYHYFRVDQSDVFKIQKLCEQMDTTGRPEEDISEYAIKINRFLYMYSTHTSVPYELTPHVIRAIIKQNRNANVIILDFARDLKEATLNLALEECDEKLLVIEKTSSVLNGISYRLQNIEKHNLEDLTLVVNKEVKVKNLSDQKLTSYLKEINYQQYDIANIDFKHVCYIRENYHAIVNSLARQEPIIGVNAEFDRDIHELISTIYPISTPKHIQGSFLKKLKSLISPN